MDFPPVLFFFHESIAEGEQFFDRFWPEARGVSDSDRFFYEAFNLGRGTMTQLLGAGVWRSGVRAFLKGHGVGMPRGDTRLMSGTFLIEKNEILWEHRYAHAGDHPDYDTLMETVR